MPTNSLVEAQASLVIGTVESVEPSSIEIVLDLDAPQSIAMNAGHPTGFPRINSFLLIPGNGGALVGIVESIRIDRSPYPKRKGLDDFGLVDLPFPLRKLRLSPIGFLVKRPNNWELSRGVASYPSVADPVLLPSRDQSIALVEAMRSEDRRVPIGRSLLAEDATISVDPDRIFGRHLAVLGNTGSGKSCSVAGLIRWSLDAATEALAAGKTRPNARFLILDPNGEYAKAFADVENTRVFGISLDAPEEADEGETEREDLNVPGWLWNGMEWSVFSHASAGIQRPLLLRALRQLRAGLDPSSPPEQILGLVLSQYGILFEIDLQNPASYSKFPGQKNAHARLEDLTEICSAAENDPDMTTWTNELHAAAAKFDQIRQQRTNGQYTDPFMRSDIDAAIAEIQQLLAAIGFDQESGMEAVSEDAPIPFKVDSLPSHVEALAMQDSAAQQHLGGLTMRLKAVVRDGRLSSIVAPEVETDLLTWLSDYVGSDQDDRGPIAIVDLSLVPSDVIQTVVSVIGRVAFEALQRYRREFGKPLPTVVVLDEAHTFVKRRDGGDGEAFSQADVCRTTFERIAREGRKFGMGLVLASQRPSELSPTALSQCNTFLLHRLVNDKDQALVSRLVPDRMGGLLDELPSLPSRHAILMGWSTVLPTMLEMRELPEEQRPRSADPDFWDVWTGQEDRPVEWETVIETWTGSQ